MTPQAWKQVAQILALGILVATPVVAFMSVTIGIVTGLIVLFVPLYALVAWLSLVAIAVALCMWRRHPVAARVVGSVLALAPAVASAGWYVSKVVGCRSADDPRACLDYLNGSPLLPAAVALVVLLGVVAAVAAWLAAGLSPVAADGR